MALDERSYPTPPLSGLVRLSRKIVRLIEEYWADRLSRRMRWVSRHVSSLGSRPA
jgi:hypothetical protein